MTTAAGGDGRFGIVGKIVLVSGGTRGIGQAIALACHEAGAVVTVTARQVGKRPIPGTRFVACDVQDEVAVKDAVAGLLASDGRIDVLFNVAGVNVRHAAETFPTSEYDRIQAVNVRGSFLMAREVGATMVARESGKIVNIASLHSVHSLPGVSAYGASKGAVAALTRALAVEWAPRHVQVNAIAPGLIRTDLNASLWEDPALAEWARMRTPAGRLGEPDDVVGAALFLASPASDFITGQVLAVDGGLSTGSWWPLDVAR